ncbi:sugar ABC transporter substrate-binding protein [Paraburkholderia sp. DD10]|uniref:Monosaccharide ABC transporter substrate-binding protein, CUT2 family n=1 Tax=Paraburkholderia terricola TaxID=169427 RepID=A0A1M6T3U8_9BURK|nr:MULTISPECIES: sugar ABC transporter substrate-binding protein [Paraburkholderia]SDO70411.1 monosaccharide ABC transporter substrate-binding protein, CUT2 family [Paraburkholderia sediminicola]SHK51584.1 monosaccharide ABC transporter substrate-binding protein, CUT2 family [Paraburkholderia terricola]
MNRMSRTIKLAGLTAIVSLTAGVVQAKQITLAYIADSMQFPYDVSLGKGFQEACKELGCKALVLDAQASVAKQANAVDDLITQKVDGIAMIPVDSVAARASVDKAAQNNVPIVSAAAQIGDPNKTPLKDVYTKLTALVTTDDVAAGARAGELAAKVLPKDRVVTIAVIEGAPGFAAVRQRSAGFKEALDKAGIKYTIVASQPTDWTPEKGESVCQNVLVAHQDLDLFFSQADDMAIGCARAVRSSNAKTKIIATAGGSRLGNDAIKSGRIYGSVCTKPETLGRLTAKALYDAATGKNTAKAQFITYDTPAITKENLSVCPAEW